MIGTRTSERAMARKTVYCVQPFTGARGRQVPGRLQQFGDDQEARAAGRRLSARVSGVVVYLARGEPDFDSWEAEVLEVYGEVPGGLSVVGV